MLAEEAIKKAIEDVKVKNDEKKEWEHKWLKIIDYENELKKDSHQKTLKFNFSSPFSSFMWLEITFIRRTMIYFDYKSDESSSQAFYCSLTTHHSRPVASSLASHVLEQLSSKSLHEFIAQKAKNR